MLKENLNHTSHFVHHTSNKGITLIALVITIIVMLILVAVTINMAINGGLFEKAGQAVEETQNAINAEQQLANGGIKIGDKWYASIDNYINIITASVVHSDLPTYLGKTVNYGVTYADASTDGEGKWELFYADENNIYIITKGHLAAGDLSRISGYNGTSDFTAENLASKYQVVAAGLFNKTYDPTAAGTETDPYLKYTSSYTNMKATEYLLDSTKWSTYVNSELAEWAIGGPTFELFVKSYNAYYTEKTDVELSTPSSFGYASPLSVSNSVPSGTYLNYSTNYWLACPSGNDYTGVRYVSGLIAYVGSNTYSNGVCAFRPVVCLNSNVSLSWDSETSQFNINLIEE